MTPSARWAFLHDSYDPLYWRLGEVVSFDFRLHQVIAVHGSSVTLRRLSWRERRRFKKSEASR